MVDRKIPGSYRPAESAGFFLDREQRLPKPSHVYYAGQSHRRLNHLRNIFPDVPITTTCVDPEPVTESLELIVNHKLAVVLADSQLVQSSGGVIIAADTQTIVPSLDAQGRVARTHKTKPSSEEEVRTLFEDMSTLSSRPEYSVVSASVTHDILAGKQSPIHLEETQVALDQDCIAYLATREGFERYRDAFAEFYSSDVYCRNGLPQIGLRDISSGLSLPVLTLVGAVKEIDGFATASGENFREAFERALHIVAIGFSPELLSDYELKESSWVKEVTQVVLP